MIHDPQTRNSAALDQWLRSPSQVGLLVGRAGSGKTQLLEEWSAKLRDDGQWTVVTLFVARARGNWLARDWVTELQVLLEQAGLACSRPQNCNWRQLLYSIGYELGTDDFNDGKPTLLILDGLFESPSEVPDGVFAPTLAQGLKLVFSCESDHCPKWAARGNVIVIPQPEWDGTLLSNECELRGIDSKFVPALSRVHFGSALQAAMLLDAVACGLVTPMPDDTSPEVMLERVLRQASRVAGEILSLLANCLAPLSHADLVELLDEEHRNALEKEPLIAVFTTTTPYGVTLRNESLNAVVSRTIGLDWGGARLGARCGALSAASPDAYAFRFGAHHWLPAAGAEALLAFLDPERQLKWQSTPSLCWLWADESRSVVRRIFEALLDEEPLVSSLVGGMVRGVLQNATVHELSEAVVGGDSDQPTPIDDHDVLAVALAKSSRFANHQAAQDIAHWALNACRSKPLTGVEVALMLPAPLRGAVLLDLVRDLITSTDTDAADDGGYAVVLSSIPPLFEADEYAAIEILSWAYEKYRDPSLAGRLARRVASFPACAKRLLCDWAKRDGVRDVELEAALVDTMDSDEAGSVALGILSLRATQQVNSTSVGRALRHVPEAELSRLANEFSESEFAGDLAARYMSLGLWDQALDLMSRTRAWRESIAAAVVLGAAPGDRRCKDVLRSLDPDELARIVEGNGSALLARHGVQSVFSWAEQLSFAPRCLVALVRHSSAQPPSWAVERLVQLAEHCTSTAELGDRLALGPWSRPPEAPAWVVEALSLDQVRQYLVRLVEPLLEASSRRVVVDDDPHLDLIDLMPLIRRVAGDNGLVEVAQALRDCSRWV